jgi:AmiR/NasT family two-component response regulator
MAGNESEGLEKQVHDLEHQIDVDRELFTEFAEQGVVDRAQIDTLQTALATCRRIGIAMGILMSSHRITEAEAFERLRGASQNSHRKLRHVAEDVLLTGALG